MKALCNLCGSDMCLGKDMDPSTPYGLHGASVSGGYFSKHLIDGNHYIFNLCEKCLRDLFIKFIIPPKIDSDFITNSEFSFKEDQKMYEYSIWCENGGHHQAYLNTKCNSVKDCPNDAVYTIKRDNQFTEDSSCEEHRKLKFNRKYVPFIPNNLKIFL